MMDVVIKIGAIVGLLTGVFTVWDRIFRARPIAYVIVKGSKGNWFRYVRVVNTDKADVQVTDVRCWPQFFSAAKNHSEQGIADAMAGQAPLALIRTSEHWDFPLVPHGGLSSLEDQKRFVLTIFWRRSSSPWLPQPPKWIVLSMRDLRRLEKKHGVSVARRPFFDSDRFTASLRRLASCAPPPLCPSPLRPRASPPHRPGSSS